MSDDQQATGAWVDMVNRKDLMTEAEHKAMKMTADLFDHTAQNVIGGNESARSGDLQELALYIHNIQRMIMSQAAGRAFPDQYRLLGEMGDWHNEKKDI